MEQVAPLVGVWIEIDVAAGAGKILESLPSWECGLKSHRITLTRAAMPSLPSWECGLKYITLLYFNEIPSRSPRGSVD